MIFLSHELPYWFSPALPNDIDTEINDCFFIILEYQMISFGFSKNDEMDLILLQLLLKLGLLFFFYFDDPSRI